jgi:hypothetical protein
MINTWERNFLKVYGPVSEQGVWVTNINQELREPKKKTLSWYRILIGEIWRDYGK